MILVFVLATHTQTPDAVDTSALDEAFKKVADLMDSSNMVMEAM